MMLVVPPLRIPDDVDITKQLAEWLDEPHNREPAILNSNSSNSQLPAPSASHAPRPYSKSPDFFSGECMSDLERLDAMRRMTGAVLSKGYDASLQAISSLQEYAAALKELEDHGFPTCDADGMGLTFTWSSAQPVAVKGGRKSKGFPAGKETHCSITWERANVLWNLAALEAYKASILPLENKAAWKKAGVYLQNAACVVRHIRTDILLRCHQSFRSLALSKSFLKIWESFLMAEAQRAAFETFLANSRPNHFMLAKLSAAAIPLFQEVEDACQLEENLSSVDLLIDWEDSVRAWGMYMSAVTDFHQAMVHQEKQEWGMELARLEGAVKFSSLCRDFCDQEDSDNLDGLAEHLKPLLVQVGKRLEEAEKANEEHHHAVVPDRDELPEIPPQSSVNVDQDITRILPSLSEPLFKNVLDPSIRHYADLFRSQTNVLVAQTAQLGEEKTESARKALAVVNLPHSLTAFRQEQSGGGIPIELWERVEKVQNEGKVELLKQEMWELRDLAESGRNTYRLVSRQLDEDLEMDGLFREQNPSFQGHDVRQIQRAFREALQNYDRLMSSAQESDALLLRQCEILDTDPKFKLLRFQKIQLDRLLPGRGSREDVDVSALSQYLVDLSTLFNDREALVHSLRERTKTYNITQRLIEINTKDSKAPESAYMEVVNDALRSLDGYIDQMQDSIGRQTELVDLILKENEEFMKARESLNLSSSGDRSSDKSIVKIEDALEEIDQFSKHLKEGKTFYDGIIPKLGKLKLQVGDVSARLASERFDFEERTRRNRQEADDANFAATLGGAGGGSSGPSPHPNGRGGRPYDQRGDPSPYDRREMDMRRQTNPGVESVSHRVPDVRVDDEKVATLVAMDFDPDRVVAALKKYDNNFEQALNDLLS